VKRYESTKIQDHDTWRHERITLRPLNPEFEPIELDAEDEDRLKVITEFVEVLPTIHLDAAIAESHAGDRRVGVV
jgi:hypothetical protein